MRHGLVAYYGTRHGGSACRAILTFDELEKLLRGGFNCTNVRVETRAGEECGWRERHDDGKWFWCYDKDIARAELTGTVTP